MGCSFTSYDNDPELAQQADTQRTLEKVGGGFT